MADNLFAENAPDGFRLDFFQLYNWGIFNGTIYTVDAKNKSTLLTGENGSGKTTLVDALMTLLVPQNMRFYNQSSGSNHKHDRSEESYVLGAYGNKQEGSGEAKTQTLRDSTAYSILAGAFTNERTQSTVSLLQVRFFSGDSLQRVFAVTKQKLSIQDINAILNGAGVRIDRTSAWRKVLSAEKGTVFFGDNFKKYSESYSALFGFRSDKALRLFSQIVGLKVLGNLTDFIRTNMLEEQDTIVRYELLRSGYQNLMQANREIQKAKAQIELLEPIAKSGEKWKDAKAEKLRLSSLREYAPAWYTARAREIISDELEHIRETLQHSIDSRDEELAVQDEIQKEIDSIKISIAQNAASQRLTLIRDKIDSLLKERRHVEEEKQKYNQKLASLGIEPPLTPQGFEDAKKAVKARQSEAQSRKTVLDKQRIELFTAEREENQRIEEIRTELSSLGTRPSSNIPFENIEIRARICEALSIDEEKLPFAGELLRVKDSESHWSYAIERLLHNFALTLLVTSDIYDDVTDFVKNTNMRGRVVYLKTEDEFFLSSDEEPAENTVPGKIEVRQSSALCEWLSQYVRTHFDFLCTDDTDEIARAKQALSSSGLVKKGLRHEKDDRRHIQQSSQVLGWDNSAKRQDLSAELDELSTSAAQKSQKRLAITAELDDIEEKIRAVKNAGEITQWSQIDTDGFDDEIGGLRVEEARLLSGDENIKELQKQLDEVLAKKEKSTERVNTFTGIIAVLQDKQKGREEKLSSFNQTFELLRSVVESEKGNAVRADFEAEYGEFLGAKNLEELEKASGTISARIEEKSADCTKKEAELSQLLVRLMSAVKNPNMALREKFGDWSAEFMDMDSSTDYLDDYVSVYNRLLTDNLPRYQAEFNEYLHETMNNDIVDFHEYIASCAEEIRSAVSALNESLRTIAYESAPETYLQLIARDSSDVRIKEIRAKLHAALPDSERLNAEGEEGETYREELFSRVKELLDYLDLNEANRRFVLDIRNWFSFAASENYALDGTQKQYYNDSASLSGGEKAKLTYTILASAIAYQFGINRAGSSFRFVIVDEAFSKSDIYNSEYAMRLFKQIDLQLMVVTPFDKINIVEDYISSVHLTENKNTNDSRLLSMSIQTYKSEQQAATM